MEVLYCDNHLLVVIKPAGIPTQLGCDELAKQWIKKKYQKPGKVFLEPVHRLDKPVSGIVLFARTSKALARLQQQMRDRAFTKKYLALVEKMPPHEKGVLKHYLIHGEHRALLGKEGMDDAKLAELEYKVLKKEKKTCLLEIELKTGRYHQIRAQLSAIGSPICGDKKYGSSSFYAEDAIALHHHYLEFAHPVSKETLSFLHEAPFNAL